MSAPTWLVLHDLGRPEGAAPWRSAFGALEQAVLAPDLPGHGGTPPPEGGAYDLLDAAFVMARLLAATDAPNGPFVGVGVGRSGWSATVLALAGVVDTLVLVDGLGDPWLDAAERVARRRERLHALVDHERDDPALRGDADPAMDPRLRWPPPAHGDRQLALEAAGSLSVPSIIVSTPGGRGPDAELLAAFSIEPMVLAVDAAAPQDLARAIVAAVATRRS